MAKQALGRGLSAIFEDVEEAYKQEFQQDNSRVQEIDIDKIKPNPYQPRLTFKEDALKDLAASIKKHGLLQPILVIKKDDGFMLLAGERRMRASQIAGFTTIKAIIADYESEKLRELALIENIQREDLNPIELGRAYQELIDEYNITQDGLSEIIHKSRAQITNTIRLLSLSDRTKQLIAENKISQGHAKVIVGLDAIDEETIVNTILGQRLSVRETENLVKQLKVNPLSLKKKRQEAAVVHPSLQAIQNKIANIGLKAKATKESLTINFKNSKEMENFLARIKEWE
ncbi:MAG: ParB/RepB/Spo0J family partition protein [Campylobacteraceae bacterium]|jgi:ParB family chromosome partitioning protein|nr:ParB/RepB/Spo0J family partition protein [Campylobacteraceae bacterium]